MIQLSQVHWHEGLFLRPHHLQAMQRHQLDRVASERRLAWPYPSGVIEARLSSDELENSRVRFDKLRLVMPSGLAIDVPGADDLPALDIKSAFAASTAALTVYLGVPLWSPTRSNAIDPEGETSLRTRKLYSVMETECLDENTGDNPQPVLVRRVNARLLLEADDRTDLEVLPLLRISRSTAEDGGLPRLDQDHVPACMVLAGSSRLFDLVRDLASQVSAHRDELHRRLRPGFSIDNVKGNQLRQLLKLQTLNRFAGRLTQLVNAPVVTPFAMYLELRDLFGELSALYPDRDQEEVLDYDHDNPMLVFDVLSRSIRALLPEVPTRRFKEVSFVRTDRKLVAKPAREDLATALELFLRVANGEDPKAVADLVTNGRIFKLMPESQAFRPVPGIALEEERVPPEELPTRTGLQYFRLLRSKNPPVWERIRRESSMAVFWKGLEESRMEITLCITFPGEAARTER